MLSGTNPVEGNGTALGGNENALSPRIDVPDGARRKGTKQRAMLRYMAPCGDRVLRVEEVPGIRLV